MTKRYLIKAIWSWSTDNIPAQSKTHSSKKTAQSHNFNPNYYYSKMNLRRKMILQISVILERMNLKTEACEAYESSWNQDVNHKPNSNLNLFSCSSIMYEHLSFFRQIYKFVFWAGTYTCNHPCSKIKLDHK